MTPEQAAIVREAKLRIGPAAPLVQPVPASPGEPGRVLGLGAFPDFVCELAYVPNPSSVDEVENRLRWMLLDEGAPGFGVRDYLSSIFGAEVKEIFDGR